MQALLAVYGANGSRLATAAAANDDLGFRKALAMRQPRCELSRRDWSPVEPLLPNKPRGIPCAADRSVLSGISWHLCTGSAWTGIPERHDPTTTS